jgi:CSLREA domain-containing protein
MMSAPACRSVIRTRWALFLAVLILSIGLNGDASAVNGPFTFVVNTAVDHTDDDTCDADCTLREAIHLANIAQGPDIINFDIGAGGVQTISLLWPLPDVTDPVTIDGQTQPGCISYPCIELDGTNAGNGTYGLQISAGSSTVRGLVINRFGGTGFGGAIRLTSAGGNIIEGNYLGTNVSGNAALASAMRGIFIDAPGNIIRGNLISGSSERGLFIGSADNQIVGNRIGTNAQGTAAVPNDTGVEVQNASGNTIGGPSPSDRNIISGNTSLGVSIAAGAGLSAESNQVLGNYIGLNAAGNAAIPNGTGILIEDYFNGVAINNTVAARNVISGNTADGLKIRGPGASGNLVAGNYIGTGATGVSAIGNQHDGVWIEGAPANAIGGSAEGLGNVISANAITGVVLSGSDAAGNFVQGNFIGTDATGTQGLGNGVNGMYITNAPGNSIGGTGAARNVVSDNGSNGIEIDGALSTNNVVEGNLIGTAADAISPLGNGNHGISAFDTGPNTIGGLDPALGNTIAYNTADGISIVLSDGPSHSKSIHGNSIFLNGGLGIDLDNDGVTANDPGDTDDGANGWQNSPSSPAPKATAKAPSLAPLR